jgi:glycosyltransferase involved in cell wall biosynthesis
MVYHHYSHKNLTVVNSHSVAVLPVGYALSRKLNARLIYDTHELETQTNTSRGAQGWIFKVAEKALIRKCDTVFVVSESIAEWYRLRYPGLMPVVVRNIPDFQQSCRRVNIRERLSVPADPRLFIHVGHLAEGRNIPAILEAFSSPGVEAHILFLGSGLLESLVQEYCERFPNIHQLPPVPPEQVVDYVSECDVGLCLIEPSCLSYRLSLPNKALEYVMASRPFFFTDLPEVRRFLGPEFDSWCIANPVQELAKAIQVLTATTIEGAKAAINSLSLRTWDEEVEDMIAAYVRITNAGTFTSS